MYVCLYTASLHGNNIKNIKLGYKLYYVLFDLWYKWLLSGACPRILRGGAQILKAFFWGFFFGFQFFRGGPSSENS